MKRKNTERIVFHRAEVWTGDDYHCIIMKDGSFRALVPYDDVAWHACKYNQTTLGVAIFGDFASSEPGLNWHPTDAQIRTCLSATMNLNKLYGGKLWGAGHSELGLDGTVILKKLVEGHTCPGEHFPLQDVIRRAGLQPFTKTKMPANLIV